VVFQVAHEHAEPVDDTKTDDAARAKRLRDPDAQARVNDILERRRRGEPPGPGITAEDLPDFLRKQEDALPT
jgi:hypothetical protein